MQSFSMCHSSWTMWSKKGRARRRGRDSGEEDHIICDRPRFCTVVPSRTGRDLCVLLSSDGSWSAKISRVISEARRIAGWTVRPQTEARLRSSVHSGPVHSGPVLGAPWLPFTDPWHASTPGLLLYFLVPHQDLRYQSFRRCSTCLYS